MVKINQSLYECSPAYRLLADELYVLASGVGSLEAAYRNAINDQVRMREELRRHGIQFRDDPGRGGSGGAG